MPTAPPRDTEPEITVVNFGPVSGVAQLVTGAGWLLGLLAWNDQVMGAARVDVVDGADLNGEQLGRLYVAALTHTNLNLPRPGWPFQTGLTVNVGATPASGAALIARKHR